MRKNTKAKERGTMKKPIKQTPFLLLLSFLLSILKISTAIDIINTTQIFRDGDVLVSSGGRFELGFFSPGSSNNRYVGIWYHKIPNSSAVWVANREIPVRNTSGILKVTESGILVVLNDTNNIIWSSNTSRVAPTPVLQLLDSGNLVLREANDDRPDNFLWQSFDYLSDTSLPGVNIGWNFVTGVESYLSSWKTSDDPARGDFTFHLDPTGYPQLVIKRGPTTLYRLGPWNGLAFSGQTNSVQDMNFRFVFIMNKDKVYHRLEATDSSVISRIILTQSGTMQRWTWVDRIHDWIPYVNFPADNCDTYKLCGAYGSCNIANTPACVCLDKFEPKDPEGWSRSDWTNGCNRRTPLNCLKGDIFLKYSGIKLPDSRNSKYNKSMTLEECKVECVKDCSCMAYTQLNISGEGSGCLFWYEDLIDIRDLSSHGQDIYIRMASSELDSKGKGRKILISSLTAMGVVLLGLSLTLYYRKRKKNCTIWRTEGSRTESHKKDYELPLYRASTISKATNNFSENNKLGQGGYGPVYKGTLEDGQDVAVKRLSKTSMQGLDEFKNEVICIAKLQHRNLVKLLGCCIEGEEKMLIYEYMPNKSLDLILFDQTRSALLDWPKRLQIVNGVARGLMYIHQDSRMRIIHRDLKASNILLDDDMNPKISDFGIARSFGGNETEDKTSRVVGTYGYMSPEYAVHGRFSQKSDVFSFGVLVLEIVIGKRNSGFSHGDQHLNLLGHAWTLYKEERSLELVDAYLRETANLFEVLRLIHVGLLCVQQCPDDRPSMASVVAMLGNDAALPQANQPGFFAERDVSIGKSITSSSNEMTITQLEAR
ncbi:G-type lectin S-receptor-like serine/threonine-protein kinase At4g27290 isoform X1 [Olea europaea var. sylvestris]|uniref:G-type lectin S-receptor-like serine/threonine-protein kinase At4g27290 isoform X1 n=1 Tax=Olea europaea var. sylvestris TaxID=158386 RepID=UPI000C1CD650|nr:G-type lectin S-receptor-like serine/threonine-protein kinase At4g27290 isoform X1 [Olea europaea var. sylvestris]